jgi:Pyruvate/2-oxoacid:ferredoxin oxidoreductase delta subunit
VLTRQQSSGLRRAKDDVWLQLHRNKVSEARSKSCRLVQSCVSQQQQQQEQQQQQQQHSSPCTGLSVTANNCPVVICDAIEKLNVFEA